MTGSDTTPKQPMKLRAPLGIPRGSIRASLTILVVGFIVFQTAEEQSIGLLWSETLMIMLAHYFTSRRFVELPRDVRAQLEAEGKIPVDANPLYLPKHSIRGLIVLAFVGLAWYLYSQGRLFESKSLTILGPVSGYFLGILAKVVVGVFRKEGAAKPANWWDDIKAFATLLIVAATVAVEFLNWGNDLPLGLTQEQLESTMLTLVLFYFGSR
ncbi:MAG: hypothetical protein KDA84_09310 [Planctomycetaceae bacterium]|nr:hypothetical protein [Planctomycetaceae bacterium]